MTKKKLLHTWIKNVALETTKSLKIKKSLSLVVVGQAKIKKINFLYRQKNKPTDVLSFEGEGELLGEIFLCWPIAKKQAKQYSLTLKEELARLIIHGILHLLGYDHEKGEQESKKMFDLQDKLLGRFTKKYVSTT
ncbi:MAG: rRNA maturation RNase YbeY [Candidatus Magasanikbacteria bacterium]|nr:rRNA maturation RNase YbeY [Candidatus Magasanikbacteria bacterium]